MREDHADDRAPRDRLLPALLRLIGKRITSIAQDEKPQKRRKFQKRVKLSTVSKCRKKEGEYQKDGHRESERQSARMPGIEAQYPGIAREIPKKHYREEQQQRVR